MPAKFRMSKAAERFRSLSARVNPDGQKELLYKLAEALTGELIRIPVGPTGNMRRGITLTTLPYKIPGGWAIGVGDLSILGDPSEPAPSGTISAFLKWYRETYKTEERRARKAKARVRKPRAREKPKERIYGKGKKGEPLASVYVPKKLDELVEAEAAPVERYLEIARLEEQQISILRQIGPLVRARQQAQRKISDLSSAIKRMRESSRHPSARLKERIAQYEKQLADVQRQLEPIDAAYDEAQKRLHEIERQMSQ